MKSIDLKNKTTEKLESTLKAIKIIIGVLIGVLTLFFIIAIYGLITNENKSTFLALIAVSISLSAVLPIQIIIMKNIKNELNTRKENK